MWHIHGYFYSGIDWTEPKYNKWDDEDEGVKISFILNGQRHNREAIKIIERDFKEHNIPWVSIRHNEWILDLNKLKKAIPNFPELEWFKGKISLEPEVEIEEDNYIYTTEKRFKTKVACYIVPDYLEEHNMLLEVPVQIKESLERFKMDYPDPTKVAFIMMQFGKTKAHEKIVEAIKTALDTHGIIGIRADDKQYHDDLFPNVQTYLYGCGMGIAVFERIEEEEFNPNVSLEVGYMLASNKHICLLKDKTLRTLHTDLVGKLYRSFDPQDPIKTIPEELTRWLTDKEII